MDDHMLEDGEINEERPKLEVMHISDYDGELVPTIGSLSDFFLFNSRRGPFFLSFDEDPHYYEDDKIKYDSVTTADPLEKFLSNPDTHLDMGSFWRKNKGGSHVMFLHGPPVHNDDYQRRWDDPEGNDHNYDAIKTIFEGPTKYDRTAKNLLYELEHFVDETIGFPLGQGNHKCYFINLGDHLRMILR
jgi:hypothetical protein